MSTEYYNSEPLHLMRGTPSLLFYTTRPNLERLSTVKKLFVQYFSQNAEIDLAKLYYNVAGVKCRSFLVGRILETSYRQYTARVEYFRK